MADYLKTEVTVALQRVHSTAITNSTRSQTIIRHTSPLSEETGTTMGGISTINSAKYCEEKIAGHHLTQSAVIASLGGGGCRLPEGQILTADRDGDTMRKTESSQTFSALKELKRQGGSPKLLYRRRMSATVRWRLKEYRCRLLLSYNQLSVLPFK